MAVFFWPWAKVAYEVPKVWFFTRWVELLVVLAFLDSAAHIKTKKINLWLLTILGVWTVIAVLASILGQDVAKSFAGNYYRVDGLTTLFHLLGFCLFVGLFWQESWKKLVSLAFVIGTTAVSGWIIVDAIKLFLFHQLSVANWNGALGGPFGQPVFLGGFLLVCLPFTLFLIATEKRLNKVYIVALILQIIGIFLTRSLAPTLGILILFLLWWCLTKQKKLYWLISIIVGAAALVAVMFYWWGSIHPSQFIVAESRERIFTKLFLAVKQKPLLGYGWANVDYAFDSVIWPIKFNTDVYVDKAHSHLLESAVTTGLAGLAAYVLVLIGLGSVLVRRYLTNKSVWNIALLCVFCMFVFHTQTNVISISEEIIFWLLLGIGLTKD